MEFLKIGGRIYDTKLNAQETAAMNRVIEKQVAEYDRKNSREIDAMVLMILCEEFGWGEVRLKRFHHRFIKKMDELCERYELETEDEKFLALQWIKDRGIDLEEWSKDYEASQKAGDDDNEI